MREIDFPGIEELDDDDLEQQIADYQVIASTNSTYEWVIDSGYNQEEEARKCFNYFNDITKIKEIILIPEQIKTIYLRLVMTVGEYITLIDEKTFTL